MSATRRDFLAGCAAAAGAVHTGWGQSPAEPTGTFWFAEPARAWMGALPVGNGRLGAMVFGGTAMERLHLSESTLWSGAPGTADVRPGASDALPEARRLLFEGHYVEANETVGRAMLGRPVSFGTSLPLAFLEIETSLPAAAEKYRRWLDLEAGIARVAFECGGVQVTREVFASHPAGLIVVRIESSDALDCVVRFAEPRLPGEISLEGEDTLCLAAHAWETVHSDGKTGVGCEARVRILAERGTVKGDGHAVRVHGAAAVTILVAVATDFLGGNPERATRAQLARAVSGSGSGVYRGLRASHVADYRELYTRVALHLDEDSELAHLPVDKRRARLEQDGSAEDQELCALFFQYGRYLTLSASREDSPLPMALQGIWNDGLAAAMGWADDFHLDINTEQNYWPCEVANLAECHTPVARWLRVLAHSGQRTAQQEYGAPGWVAHVTSNAWGYSAPGWGLGWSMFVTGGVWIAMQVWRHYQYMDGSSVAAKQYLRETVWPLLREAALFFLAYMVEYPGKGWLVTGPSLSPENAFLAPGTRTACANSMGPTCDRVLVFALLTACIDASETLDTDQELRTRMREARAKLPPLQIGRHGQLQEWLFDFEEAYPNHRHTSHLIALYPERQITPEATPALAQAARVTLERRIRRPDWEDTEWSRANLVNYYARLGDGDAAHRQLLGLMAHATDGALLAYSRGGVAGAASNIFAIDGNTAGAAGIAEMLLQSQPGRLQILPALPTAWPRGSVLGLRAAGGMTVSVRWRAGTLVEALVAADNPAQCIVAYRGMQCAVRLSGTEACRITLSMFLGKAKASAD